MLRFGKKSVFWKWIISYISVIFVLIVCNVVTYVRSVSIMNEKQAVVNELTLQQLSERFYDSVVQMEHLREIILVNNNYMSLAKSSILKFPALSYRQYLLHSDLKEYRNVNGGYSKVMIHFEEEDYIIASNSVNTSEWYWKIYNSELGMDYAQWQELLNGTYSTFFTQKINIQGKEGIVYARTIQTMPQKTNLYLLFTEEDMERLLARRQGEQTVSLALKSKAGGEPLVFDSAGLLAGEGDRERLIQALKEGSAQVVTEANERLSLTYQEDVLAGAICLISSENVFLGNMRQFQSVFILTFAITILFSLVLIFHYARRNYQPLKDLLDVLGPEEWAEVNYPNEFVAVKERVHQVQDDYKTANLHLRRQNRLFREEYFAKLLSGNIASLPEEGVEEFYGICYISDIFVVMLFYIEDFTMDAEMEGSSLDKAQFVLSNVYQEILTEEACRVYQTKIADLLALVVNLPENSEEAYEAIFDRVLVQGAEFIDRHFNMDYSITISNAHHGKGELASAYQEALQSLESKRLYGLEGLVHYKDIVQLSGSSYYYPIEVEQDFIRQIQLSNFEQAMEVYEEVMGHNINGKVIASQDTLRCLMYDMVGTVLKTLGEREEDQKFAKELRPMKRMSLCRSLEEMRAVFEEILKAVCTYMSVEAAGEDHGEFCRQIQEYIKKNYKDPNLSVTSIAEYFSVPPVTMSKMFRETTGEKIPVFVSDVRLRAAKELMCSTNASLGEIAERVGFGSARTFTRIFKQMEDCTPGQWREAQM